MMRQHILPPKLLESSTPQTVIVRQRHMPSSLLIRAMSARLATYSFPLGLRASTCENGAFECGSYEVFIWPSCLFGFTFSTRFQRVLEQFTIFGELRKTNLSSTLAVGHKCVIIRLAERMLFVCHEELAHLHLECNNWEAAREQLEKAYLIGKDANQDVGSIALSLGVVLQVTGQLQPACDKYIEALVIGEESGAMSGPKLLRAMMHVGYSHLLSSVLHCC